MIITENLLNNISAEAKINARMRKNFDLRSSEADQSQRMLNALEPGTVIPIHRHRDSSEIVTIVRGGICEKFYDENGKQIEAITLRYGEGVPMLVVPKGMWHNLECLEAGTIIYESKDGAYQPTSEADILDLNKKNRDFVTDRKTIYLCLAHMSGEGLEQKYIKEAFDTNWVVPLGPNVNAFEKDLETFVGEDKKVVALSAGTAAVHLALIGCGVGPGDEVCVQSFTFCASSHPIKYLGATPVFIDSEKDSWNMDPKLLEQAIIDRKAQTGKYPKAIIPVALYGMPYRIEDIMQIANKYGIPVIEDAAEGMGSRWKGQVLGTFGDYGILSFNGNKMITTSGGGALICKDAKAKNKVMWLATQACEAYPYYQHETIGFNYRLSNICAGIGRGQMTILDQHLAHHKHVQARYAELLKDVPGIHLHEAPNADFDANYWLCTITIDPDVRIKGQENAYKETVKSAVGGAAGVIHQVDSPTTDCQPNANVEALRVYMLERKIEAQPVWKPMHKQPVYADCPAYVNGISEALFKVGMCLPAGPMVSDEDIDYIVESIKSAIL